MQVKHKILILSVVCVLLSICIKLQAQDTLQLANLNLNLNEVAVPDTNIKQVLFDPIRNYDKITFINGSTIIVTIIESNSEEVTFKYPLNTVVNEASKTELKEIVFANGDKESILQAKPKDSNTVIVSKWEKIELYETADSLAGFQEMGVIKAKYSGQKINTPADFIEKNCVFVLRKKAANMNADAVLIQQRFVFREYGEIPFLEITGKAYKRTN